MRTMRLPILLIAIAALLVSPKLPAESPPPLPLRGIEIEDHRGVWPDRSLRFRDHEGRLVTLGDYFDGTHPVILQLAYYDCPMLCSLVMNGLNDGLRSLAWSAGKEFRVLTISIDRRDTPPKAKAKRQTYLDAYGRMVGDKGWDFLVSEPESVEQLAKAIGFNYRWDAKTEQFAHAAGAFVFTPQGKLSQVLHGVRFEARGLRLSLTESSEGKLGSTWDRILLLCYHYDPNAQGYVVASVRLMRIGGFVTMFVLFAWLYRVWRKEINKPPMPA